MLFQDLSGGPIFDNSLANRLCGCEFGDDGCQQAIVIGDSLSSSAACLS